MVSHAGTVVPECYKDDVESQWKSLKCTWIFAQIFLQKLLDSGFRGGRSVRQFPSLPFAPGDTGSVTRGELTPPQLEWIDINDATTTDIKMNVKKLKTIHFNLSVAKIG